MEDAPLLSLLAEGCEGSQLADSGTVSGGTGDTAPGLEPVWDVVNHPLVLFGG